MSQSGTPRQSDFGIPEEQEYQAEGGPISSPPPSRPESHRDQSWSTSRGSVTLSDPPVRWSELNSNNGSVDDFGAPLPPPRLLGSRDRSGSTGPGMFTASPETASPASFSPVPSPRLSATQQLRRETPSLSSLSRAIEVAATEKNMEQQPLSPGQSSRWEQVRRYAGQNVAGTTPANTPPAVPTPIPVRQSIQPPPPLPSSKASVSSFSSLTPSQTVVPPTAPAKTPRLGRFGFRQVVEQATTQVNMDATARFDHDLRRACWEVRYGGSAIPAALSDGGVAGVGGVAPSASTSAFNLPLTAGWGKQTQQQAPAPAGAQGLQILHQALIAHAPLTTSSTGPSRNLLPLENEVLAVLLGVFLSGDGTPRAEGEKWLALETFEMITKTWRSPSAEVHAWPRPRLLS